MYIVTYIYIYIHIKILLYEYIDTRTPWYSPMNDPQSWVRFQPSPGPTTSRSKHPDTWLQSRVEALAPPAIKHGRQGKALQMEVYSWQNPLRMEDCQRLHHEVWSISSPFSE